MKNMCDNKYHQSIEEGQFCNFCGARRMIPFDLSDNKKSNPCYLLFRVGRGCCYSDPIFDFIDVFESAQDAIDYLQFLYNKNKEHIEPYLWTEISENKPYLVTTRKNYEFRWPYCCGEFGGYIIEPTHPKIL